ncbi:MAG: hypothetical protein KGQ46_05840 [Hyphomicrobiales bacterium]|nr:hypothetical protein [Hyphomicrobiales bacterium]
MANNNDSTPVVPDRALTLTPAQLKSRRARNVALALAIGFLVILFYAVTIIKLGPGVLKGGV